MATTRFDITDPYAAGARLINPKFDDLDDAAREELRQTAKLVYHRVMATMAVTAPRQLTTQVENTVANAANAAFEAAKTKRSL